MLERIAYSIFTASYQNHNTLFLNSPSPLIFPIGNFRNTCMATVSSVISNHSGAVRRHVKRIIVIVLGFLIPELARASSQTNKPWNTAIVGFVCSESIL